MEWVHGPVDQVHGYHQLMVYKIVKMISAIESVTKGSDFMKAKGYAPSNLGPATEIGRLRIDRGAATTQDRTPSGTAIGAR
jgi:hypothetical protein